MPSGRRARWSTPPTGRLRGSRHRREGLQLHHAARRCRSRRHLARVRPRPGTPGPVRRDRARPDTDVAWWDLMSTGSHSGPLFQTIPTHMGAWSKYVLGWINPKVLPYDSAPRKVVLGQASKVPAGIAGRGEGRAARRRRSQVGAPHSGDQRLVDQQRPERCRRDVDASGRRPSRLRRPLLDVERLHDRRALGLRVRRGLHR